MGIQTWIKQNIPQTVTPAIVKMELGRIKMNERAQPCTVIKISQEIPCEYGIEEFQEYQNPIKVTLTSPLKGTADCD